MPDLLLGLAILVAAMSAAPPIGIAQVSTRSPAWYADETRYDVPFFEGANYDPHVPTPTEILGFEPGTRPATHAELERCLTAWSESAKMTVHEYARTHERRALYYAVITSKKNHARLPAIREAIGKLADPRKLNSEAEAQRIIREAPGVAWMAYSIHGDETSGTDASLALIYHLLACTDADVAALLDDVVILVDPLMNPDGRERYIRQLDEYAGYTPNLDAAARQHAGRWPWGRGNHYLFDLNRDWILGVHPETRGRRAAIVKWNPQLLVDAHEMGAHNTYLFNPPREPFNPRLPSVAHKWWNLFADEQAQAFDRFGWSYYTREWLEFWYPGYSDSWASYLGAISILYEQAGVGGRPIRQKNGSILTYRETVHHQLVSSLANLQTLRANRQAILSDFLRQKRQALESTDDAAGDAFLLLPGANRTRVATFLDNLHEQGIEIGVARDAFVAQNLTAILGEKLERREFPAGTIVIPRQQPAGPLVGAILDFDPRMSAEFLTSERKELETKRDSRIYDITGWSLPMAYGLDAYWSDTPATAAMDTYRPAPPPAGSLVDADNAYGYVIDGSDDASVRALAALLQAGVKVRVARKEFTTVGRKFARGSLLMRRHENNDDLPRRLRETATATGITVHAVTTARSPDEGPDLGGGRFILLNRPRVGLFGGYPVSPPSYGAIWHLLDHEVGLAVSLLSVAERGRVDLRRFNVIILPPARGSPEKTYKPMLDDLKKWVGNGGTLIAVGNAAAFLTDEKAGLGAVRRRRDVLSKLGEYAYAVKLERAAGKTTVVPEQVWDEPVETVPATMPGKPSATDEQAKAQDEWRRIFSPQGVIVRGELDSEHWLTFGCPQQMPLFASGSTVLMSQHPVKTPVRFAPAERLRLSGLLWPEAATRMADSAYATVERVGKGQVILFAHHPDFRGTWHASRRLLVNTVLLGPGCGTSQPAP